jgi:hypothetical protein
LETFQSFLGDLNESKSPLNPFLSKVNMGTVFDVALDYHSSHHLMVFVGLMMGVGYVEEISHFSSIRPFDFLRVK